MSTFAGLISANGFNTGLSTLAYAVSSADGTSRIARTTSGVSEIGGGSYKASPVLDTSWFPLLIVWDDTTTWATETQGLSEALASAPGGSSGAGAYAYTVTVTASAIAVNGAAVSMTNGALVYTATTNSSGVASFSLDAATYTLAIFKPGYTYTPSSVTVSAAGNTAASITATAVTPASAPSQTTGYLTCYNLNGSAASGISITVELVNGGISTAGLSYPTDDRTATSDANGLVQFTGLLRSRNYRAKRGPGEKWHYFTAADATTTALPEVLGRDA
jgi:hypothetical protein